MRNIRFRYRFNSGDGNVVTRVLTINEIELGYATPMLRRGVLSRDLSTGFVDIEGDEAFENDEISFLYEPCAALMSHTDDPNHLRRIIKWNEEEQTLEFVRFDGEDSIPGYTYCRSNFENVCKVEGRVSE